jgi:hypothetical protein
LGVEWDVYGCMIVFCRIIAIYRCLNDAVLLAPAQSKRLYKDPMIYEDDVSNLLTPTPLCDSGRIHFNASARIQFAVRKVALTGLLVSRIHNVRSCRSQRYDLNPQIHLLWGRSSRCQRQRRHPRAEPSKGPSLPVHGSRIKNVGLSRLSGSLSRAAGFT